MNFKQFLIIFILLNILQSKTSDYSPELEDEIKSILEENSKLMELGKKWGIDKIKEEESKKITLSSIFGKNGYRNQLEAFAKKFRIAKESETKNVGQGTVVRIYKRALNILQNIENNAIARIDFVLPLRNYLANNKIMSLFPKDKILDSTNAKVNLRSKIDPIIKFIQTKIEENENPFA